MFALANANARMPAAPKTTSSSCQGCYGSLLDPSSTSAPHLPPPLATPGTAASLKDPHLKCSSLGGAHSIVVEAEESRVWECTGGAATPDAGGRKIVVFGVLAPDCVGSNETLHLRPLRARDRPRRTSWGTQIDLSSSKTCVHSVSRARRLGSRA